MQNIKESRHFLPVHARRVIAARRILLAGAAVIALAGCASSAMAPQDAGATRDTALGKVLVDSKGKTLYTYDHDEPGASHCYGLCAAFWPPVAAAEGAAGPDGFSVIKRDGGSRQWAYRGRPLYTYVQDGKPGDVAGDGADGVWHAARR